MTGCWVVGSISAELASDRPSTLRLNSTVIACRPRHRPRHGTRFLAGVASGGDLALEAAGSEAPGNDHPVELGEAPGGEQPFDLLGLDPVDLHGRPVVEGGVLERLDDRQVGVGQLDVLADQPDAHRLRGGLDLRDDLLPRRQVERMRFETSMRSTSQTTSSRPSSWKISGSS